MSMKIIKNNNAVTYGIIECVCDTIDDITSLPQNAEMGSTALIIESKEVYMKNGSGEWVKL